MKQKKEKPLGKRKWWFRLLKKIMKIRYKKPTFVYLGEEITNGGLILSNHEGTDAPMSFEIYSGKPVRFWGANEMNSGLRKMYKYQSEVYFHQKKHWKLFPTKMFCLIASPLTNLFYKGLDLISTYPDTRFLKTVRESFDAVKRGENLVIFPEKSDNGYQDVLEGFYGGFVFFAEYCKKNGVDLPIYISYYNKKDRIYLIDSPIYFSELCKNGETREQLTKALCDRCNEIGELSRNKDFIKDNQTKKVA